LTWEAPLAPPPSLIVHPASTIILDPEDNSGLPQIHFWALLTIWLSPLSELKRA